MIARLLASAALAAILVAGTAYAQSPSPQQPLPGTIGAGAAQNPPQQAAVPAAKPAQSSSKSMTKSSSMSSARQSKKLDNVANQLNACQLRADSERQVCMSQINNL